MVYCQNPYFVVKFVSDDWWKLILKKFEIFSVVAGGVERAEPYHLSETTTAETVRVPRSLTGNAV